MRIAHPLLDQVVAHARRDAPLECCGLVAARDGAATEVHEMVNVEASRMRFEMDGKALMRLVFAIEDRGEELAAIYHSHTRSAPYPSQTDIGFSEGWPGVEWLIVGTQDDEAEVRSFRIDGGVVREVAVEVT